MKLGRALDRLQYSLADREIRRQVARVERWLAEAVPPASDAAPVVFFNASTRLYHLSLNGAYSLLASWALRARRVPVVYAVCERGMTQCILGTDLRDLEAPPPCSRCVAYSSGLFPEVQVWPLKLNEGVASEAAAQLGDRSVSAMADWEYDGLPLGRLCLPGLRWALRRHHVRDDPAVRSLFRSYLVSAASLAGRLERLFADTAPRALVLFNGIMAPEAVARAVAERVGLRTITHEVGLRPSSAFFTEGEATFRRVDLPEGFELGLEQERRLDDYLEARRLGRFSMAGVQFWPEMESLPAALEEKLERFDAVVPVFTNVIFDTSQVHANTIYAQMFAWMEDLALVIRRHPRTLFVLRAHPDEDRPGKASRESVARWVETRGLGKLSNVIFFRPTEAVSSYELIERAKFVLVYSSSIGLEAAIMGKPVLCAGRARYSHTSAALFPPDRIAYLETLEAWLKGAPPFRESQRRAARAFLFTELFGASLDLSPFLAPYPALAGMVRFSPFEPDTLLDNRALSIIADGILARGEFIDRQFLGSSGSDPAGAQVIASPAASGELEGTQG